MTLVLKGLGTEFFKPEENSNIPFAMVQTVDFVKGRDGRNYSLEFGICTRHKKAKVRHSILEEDVAIHGKMRATVCYANENTTARNYDLEERLWWQELDYTEENILKIVNKLGFEHYDSVQYEGRKKKRKKT